jgi:hypothetical protein
MQKYSLREEVTFGVALNGVGGNLSAGPDYIGM